MAEQWMDLNSLAQPDTPGQVDPDQQFLNRMRAGRGTKQEQKPASSLIPSDDPDQQFLTRLRQGRGSMVFLDPQKVERAKVLSSTLNIPFEQVFDNVDQISREFDANDPGWLKTASNSFKRGWGNVYVSAARAAEWAGMPKSLTGTYLEFGKRLQEAYMPPMKPEEFTFDKLVDARWWATTGVESVPSMLSLVPAAIIGGYAASSGAAAVGLGAFGKVVLGSLGATALYRPIESAFEAGGSYQEALLQGKSEERAKEQASFVFSRNMALAGIDAVELATAFWPLRIIGGSATKTVTRRIISALGKTAAVGTMEAGEEAYQTGVQQLARGEKMTWNAEMKEGAALGFAFGIGTGVGGSVFTTLTGRLENRMPPKLKQEFAANQNAAKVMGRNDEDAKLAAFDKLAETPEGAAFIEKEIGELRDFANGKEPPALTPNDLDSAITAMGEEEAFTIGEEAKPEPDILQGILTDEDIEAIGSGASTIEQALGMEEEITAAPAAAPEAGVIRVTERGKVFREAPKVEMGRLTATGQKPESAAPVMAFQLNDGTVVFDATSTTHAVAMPKLLERGLIAEEGDKAIAESGFVISGRYTADRGEAARAADKARAEGVEAGFGAKARLAEKAAARERQQAAKFIFTDEDYEKALAGLKEKSRGLHAGIDPTALKDLAYIGAYHLERGIRNRIEWTKAMIEQVGEWVKPHLDRVWKAANAEITRRRRNVGRGATKSVQVAADEHIRAMIQATTEFGSELEYEGVRYSGAEKVGNNVLLKGEEDKLVRGVNNILKITEITPFDVPGEDISDRPLSKTAAALKAAVQAVEGATMPARAVKAQIRRTTGQDLVVRMIREDVALAAAFKKAEQAAREAYKAGGKDALAKAKAQFRDVMLKAQARAEMFGFREGFKVAEKLTRKEFIAMFQEQQAMTKATQKMLRDYIEENLPADMRGRFLDPIINAVSESRALSVMSRVDELREKITRKELIEEIRELQEFKGNIDVEYQKRLTELLKDIDTRKIGPQTMAKITGLLEYAEREGMPSGIGPRMIEALKRLELKNVNDMTTEDLQSLADIGNKLKELGRLKRRLTLKYNARERERLQAEMIASTRNLDPKTSGKNTDLDKFKNWAVWQYLETLSGYRVPELLDNFREGMNVWLFRNIWTAEQAAHWMKKTALEQAAMEMTKIGMTELTEDQQVKLMINIRNQEGADEATLTLMQKYGYDEVPALTAKEQAFIGILKKWSNFLTDRIAAIYEERSNQPFPYLPNRILPLKYEGEQYLSAEEVLINDHRRTTQVEQGFTIARKPGVKKIPRTDVLGVFELGLDEATWYVNVQPRLDEAKYLVNTKAYMDAAGVVGAKWWSEHLHIMARRGWSSTAHSTPLGTILRVLRGNLTKAILGWRLSTIIVQPGATFDAMAYAQGKWGSGAALEMLQQVTGSWLIPGRSKGIIGESRSLSRRMGGEFAIQEALREAHAQRSLKNKFMERSLTLMMKADQKTAAGVYQGIVNILERRGVENARQEAEQIIDMLQSGSDVSFRPHVLARGEGARALFTFGTFFLNRWSIIAHDLVGKGVIHGDWKQKYTAMLGLAIIVAGTLAEKEARKYLYETLLQKDYKDRSLILDAIFALPSNIPLFGNVFEAFHGSTMDIPVAKVVNDFLGVHRVISAKTPKAKARAALKAAEAGLVLGAGVPGTSQAFDVIEAIFLPEGKKSGERIELAE